MTPEKQATVNRKLKEVAEILYKNTPDRELDTFESIELSLRDHLLKTVSPRIGQFFSIKQGEAKQEENEK